MARSCVTCSSVIFFLLLTNIIQVLSADDSYYLYGLPSSDQEEIVFESLENENVHRVHKRESVQPGTQRSPENILAGSIANATLKPSLEKNLGENGHGIRKNVTVVSDPISNSENVESPQLTTPQPKNSTNETDDQISITHFSDTTVDFNRTLKQHNITETRNDTHIYYNSTFTVDPNAANRYWIDMTNRTDVKINELLSKSHRRAATIKLKFDFPFYGHLVRNVTIATGGFLYTGEYVHSWLAATQYIAPLMANFDTSLSNFSLIKYIDNGTAFTVQWERVRLQDKPDGGEFTFQTTLLNNGDIIFVYRNVPFVVENIQDDNHPVKIGLSDAYIIDRTIFFVRRKTIYEYHRVNFKKKDIKNDTVIYLQALPTCLYSTDCQTCLTRKIANLQCTWCPTTNRCSNGLDRHRQDWFMKGCDKKQIFNESKCTSGMDVFDYGPHNGSSEDQDIQLSHNHTFDEHMNASRSRDLEDQHGFPGRTKQIDPNQSQQSDSSFDHVIQSPRRSREKEGNGSVSFGASGIIAILFLVVSVSGLSVWVLYAYRNPHTTSGQILIRYRPSQWRWKRGEARYTAATIHM